MSASKANPSRGQSKDRLVPGPAGRFEFGPQPLRLSAAQWLVTAVLATVAAAGISPLWKSLERFDANPDYRVPYEQSTDYWLYDWHLSRAAQQRDPVFVLGDSVVWGEYVSRDGSLSHYLQREFPNNRFVNAGINGLFPLALDGLVAHFGKALQGQAVLLHCNLLWMSSPEADMSQDKEQTFNHVELVPQLRHRIPCYRADLQQRLTIVVRRNLNPLMWVDHLQDTYFDGRSIPDWTLADDGAYPPGFPNVYVNPLATIDLQAPRPPDCGPDRGTDSDRHRPWFQRGLRPQSFGWVPPEQSLQWRAFQRLVERLQHRAARLFVVVGPFNRHMLTDRDVPQLGQWEQAVADWLNAQNVPAIVARPLDTRLYADASHPLTGGYETLAEQLAGDREFRFWVNETDSLPDAR